MSDGCIYIFSSSHNAPPPRESSDRATLSNKIDCCLARVTCREVAEFIYIHLTGLLALLSWPLGCVGHISSNQYPSHRAACFINPLTSTQIHFKHISRLPSSAGASGTSVARWKVAILKRKKAKKNPEHTRTLLIYVGKRNVKSTKILSQLAISAFLHKALFQAAALVGGWTL